MICLWSFFRGRASVQITCLVLILHIVFSICAEAPDAV
jgi:hypothetical protein